MFLRNLLLDEQNELHNRVMHISGIFEKEVDIAHSEVDIEQPKVDIGHSKVDIGHSKVDIGHPKVDIGHPKVDIEQAKVDISNSILLFSNRISNKTIMHAINIYEKCGNDVCFGRAIVEKITGLKSSGASKLIRLLLDSNVIELVSGHGKGKYRFR